MKYSMSEKQREKNYKFSFIVVTMLSINIILLFLIVDQLQAKNCKIDNLNSTFCYKAEQNYIKKTKENEFNQAIHTINNDYNIQHETAISLINKLENSTISQEDFLIQYSQVVNRMNKLTELFQAKKAPTNMQKEWSIFLKLKSKQTETFSTYPLTLSSNKSIKTNWKKLKSDFEQERELAIDEHPYLKTFEK